VRVEDDYVEVFLGLKGAGSGSAIRAELVPDVSMKSYFRVRRLVVGKLPIWHRLGNSMLNNMTRAVFQWFKTQGLEFTVTKITLENHEVIIQGTWKQFK
ncbi:MAG: hypothetical protein Q8P82_02845, partial [bacterium]|nr:hypothetical protein [bacterium]